MELKTRTLKVLSEDELEDIWEAALRVCSGTIEGSGKRRLQAVTQGLWLRRVLERIAERKTASDPPCPAELYTAEHFREELRIPELMDRRPGTTIPGQWCRMRGIRQEK